MDNGDKAVMSLFIILLLSVTGVLFIILLPLLFLLGLMSPLIFHVLD